MLSLTSESLIHLHPNSVQKYWAWQLQQVSLGFLLDYCSLQPPRFWFSTKQQTWQALGELAADRAIGAALLGPQQRAGQHTTESCICGGSNLKHWLQLRLSPWLCSQSPDALWTQAHAPEAITNCSFSAASSSTLSLLSQMAKATQRSQL